MEKVMERKPVDAPRRRTGLNSMRPGSEAHRTRILVVFAVAILALAQPSVSLEEAPPEQALIAPLASQSLLLDAAVADDHLVVVGERGHILVSPDGTTWTQVPVPTRATLTGVHFHGRDLGWAVGHDSVILRTRDGGNSWERVHWAPDDESPLLDVWFADAENGFAVGAYGSLYVTMDGGETWDFAPVGGDDFQPHLNQIAAGDGAIYIAAEAGLAFRSDDDGDSWTELTSPYEGSFFGVLPLDGDSLLLFGLRGNLFRSDDGGETWESIETGTNAMLNQGLRLSDGRIVIVGLSGTVLVSRDDGHTFELREQKNRAGIQSLVQAGSGDLVFVGEFGVKRVSLVELFGE
jgi:photosystem II stability/assembly factor-like uncharacterized protein